MNAQTTTKMFLVNFPDRAPALVITNDVDGPRDQATLYDAFGVDLITLYTAPPNTDLTILPYRLYDSLDALWRDVFNFRLVKDGAF